MMNKSDFNIILNRIALAQIGEGETVCERPEEWATDSLGREIAGRCCGIVENEWNQPVGQCKDDVSQRECWESYGGNVCCSSGVEDWWIPNGLCVDGQCDCWESGASDGTIPVSIRPGEEFCYYIPDTSIERCTINMGDRWKAGDEIDVIFSAERGPGIVNLATWAYARVIPEWSLDPLTNFNVAEHVTRRSPLIKWSAENDDNAPPPPHGGPQRFKIKISETFWDPMDEFLESQPGWVDYWGLYNRWVYFIVFYDNIEMYKTRGPWLFYFKVTRPKPIVDPDVDPDEKPNPSDPTEIEK